MDESEPAVSVCFGVTVNRDDLGTFMSCEGLGCEVVVEQREEGGNNAFVWQLPSRIKYPNIKLSRPVGKDTAKLTEWLAGMLGSFERQTATITVMTADLVPVASWSFEGVIPVKWTGPSLNVDTVKVATETLELAHHGFLPGRPGVPS